MADKKLVMTFTTTAGDKTRMTLSGAKQELQEENVRTSMQAMVTAGCFATSKGVAYAAPLAASYMEEVETKLFDDSEESA